MWPWPRTASAPNLYLIANGVPTQMFPQVGR